MHKHPNSARKNRATKVFVTALISTLSVSTIQAIPVTGFAIAQPIEAPNLGGGYT